MSALRRYSSLLPLLVAAALAAPAVSAAAAGGCSDRSWVAGTAEICSGTLVYRDYVYDDYGADTGALVASTPGTAAIPAGDQRYEGDVNSADLVALRLRVVGNRLTVSFELNTLLSPDSTVAALAIDTDNNPATGNRSGPVWPGLGVKSAGWEQIWTFDDGDPKTNRIEGTIPLPPGEKWRVQAVTAVKGGPVMNVAFRGPDESGRWWEDRQAAALKNGDISRFGEEVEVQNLRGQRTRALTEVGPGVHERVYTSAYTAADEVAGAPSEGMSYDGIIVRDAVLAQEYQFFGKYQPYGIYLPADPAADPKTRQIAPAPHGVQLLLHAGWYSHSALINPDLLSSKERLRKRLGDEVNRIIVVPLGRGTSSWYMGLAERDVLDVLADVESAYDVDRERIFGGGYSMGGFGTYRLVALHPDRFAGWTTWVAPVRGDCVGTGADARCYMPVDMDVTEYAGNFRNVPGAMLYAGEDEFVPAAHALAVADAFRAEDFPYVHYLHPLAEHLTFSVTDDWAKEARYLDDLVPQEFASALAAQRRSPARVTFRTDPLFDRPKLGLVHDRAYWISQIAGREPGPREVDLRAHACAAPELRSEFGIGAGVDPLPWRSEFRRVIGTTTNARANRIEGRLSNVGSLTIDATSACISSAPLAYSITTDGPATLRISDGRVIQLAGAGTHQGLA